MNYQDLDLTMIKFKKPIKFNNGYYIAIHDASAEGIIIQTPIMRICYGCNTRNPGVITNTFKKYYNYSVTATEEFTNFIEKFEENCISHLKKIKHSIVLPSHEANFTFNSSINLLEDSDPIFKIKLITDKEGNILTLLNLNTGEEIDISYIKPDNNIIQYIECSGISISNDGQVYPIWTAHQLVVIPISKIYKKKLLLDVLNKTHPEHYSCSINNRNVSHKEPPKVVNIVSKPAPKPKIMLDSSMLQNMKSKLKSRTSPNASPKS